MSLSGIAFWWYNAQSVKIKNIVLSSPNNYAFQEDIYVELNRPASIYIRYWKKGQAGKLRTVRSNKAEKHLIHLLLLETESTYEYQVVVESAISMKSKVLSFETRKQSPWLDIPWVRESKPHDATALGNGMIMLCHARLPGYIAMVDGKGSIKWLWQVDDIGVRAATFTPRGTILAMLRPPKKDIADDTPKKQKEIVKEIQKPTKRGKMGFTGGTAIAEIDLSGKELWRINLGNSTNDENKVIHHDIRMDENFNIHTLIRNKKPFDMSHVGGSGLDTLGGDGILVIDTLGNEIWKWSVWDEWDIKNDPFIERFAHDRFHMNALNFDKDGNYLVSVAIEDQIWKINARTGKIAWKFGKDGDFKMDTSSHFSFQHAIHINNEGHYMLFDNSLVKSESRALSFSLDTINMLATTRIKAPLPKSKYTSRMGSAYLMPNGNLLQASSKTGSVVITTRTGEILWELNSSYVPYRAEYVDAERWNDYFIRE